jgi:hypothetical protein
MSKQDIIRTKLQNKVFTPYGKTVTFINRVSPTYNDRGEQEGYIASTSAVTIVPYNIISKSQTYEAWGALNPGEMDAAVPYNTVCDVGTTFLMEDLGWEVKNIQLNYLPDNVVTILRLAKTQP